MSPIGWLLLDTHIWFWWIEQNDRLPKRIAQCIEEGTEALAISSLSVYELILQYKRGRIAIDLPLDDWLHGATTEAGVSVVEVNHAIARHAADLTAHHGDPFDRIIIATALYHDAKLASVDSQFLLYEALQGRLINGKDAAK